MGSAGGRAQPRPCPAPETAALRLRGSTEGNNPGQVCEFPLNNPKFPRQGAAPPRSPAQHVPGDTKRRFGERRRAGWAEPKLPQFSPVWAGTEQHPAYSGAHWQPPTPLPVPPIPWQGGCPLSAAALRSFPARPPWRVFSMTRGRASAELPRAPGSPACNLWHGFSSGTLCKCNLSASRSYGRKPWGRGCCQERSRRGAGRQPVNQSRLTARRSLPGRFRLPLPRPAVPEPLLLAEARLSFSSCPSASLSSASASSSPGVRLGLLPACPWHRVWCAQGLRGSSGGLCVPSPLATAPSRSTACTHTNPKRTPGHQTHRHPAPPCPGL